MERSKKPEQKQVTKKPYAKPAFQHEKVFETMALACGKISVSQGSCAHNKKTS